MSFANLNHNNSLRFYPSTIKITERTFLSFLHVPSHKRSIILELISCNIKDSVVRQVLYNTLRKYKITEEKEVEVNPYINTLDFTSLYHINYGTETQKVYINQKFMTIRYRDLLIKLMPEFSGKLQDIMKNTIKEYSL